MGVVSYEGAMVLGFGLTRENKIRLYDSLIDMKCQFYHSSNQTGITVDLQGQTFSFSVFFFFFHVKPSIAITTKISEKCFEKYRKERELFTKTYFRKKVCILTCH